MSENTIQPSINSNLNTIRSQQFGSDKNGSKTNLSQIKSNANSKLFYIKSKHTQKYFCNHNYFLSNQNFTSNNEGQVNKSFREQGNNNTDRKSIRILESLKKNKSQIVPKQSLQEKKLTLSKNKQIVNVQKIKEFVNEPTHFGIDNTYKYLKSKSFLLKSEHMIKMKNSIQRQRQRRIYTQLNQSSQENQQGKHYLRQTISQEKRFLQTLNQKKLSFATKKRQSSRFLNHYQGSRYKQLSMNKSQQNSLNLNKIYNIASLPDLSPIKSNLHESTECNITFIYGVRISSYNEINYRKITMNIFPFVINSFLKCKIKYTQFSIADFQFIKNAIFKVIFIKKEPFELKDIINIGSIKVLLKYLQKFPQMSTEWIQTIRYFFVAQQNILQYQLQKIKDQLRKLSALKYNAQLNSKELYLFNTQTGQLVQTLYDILKGISFVFSDKKNVIDQFNKIVTKNKEKDSFSKKINQWKNLVQDQSKKNQENRSQKQQKNQSQIHKDSSQNIDLKMSDQKFNILFQNSKKRHSKSRQKEKPSLKQFIKSSEFISKHKLKKDEDIFE